MFHLQEPLHGKLRFDGYVGTFREAYLIGIGFHLFQQSCGIEVFFYLGTYIETVHTYIHAGSFAQSTVVVEDIDGLQVVFFTQHVVVYVVSRSDFQTSCTEFDVNIIVFDDRNYAVYQRYNDLFAFQPMVLRVVRVDTHGGIAHDGFRTCGSYYGIAASLFITVYHFAFCSGFTAHIVVGNVIAQVIQFTVFFLIDHFLVRKGSQGFRVPVDHTNAAVDEPLVVQVDEYLDDTGATFLVHGESGAVPVAGCSQTAQLLQNDSTVFFCPGPGMFQEFFAGQVCLLDTLLCQFVHHLCFGSDGGVVGTRYPAGVLAHHAGTAYQNILDGIVKHVSHVENSGHVWRRDDDGVRFTSVGFRTEKFVVQPILVPFSLHVSGIVLTC